MSEPITKIVANVTVHETLIYYVEGNVDRAGAQQLVESGKYDPDDSHVRHEDVDVISVEVQ